MAPPGPSHRSPVFRSPLDYSACKKHGYSLEIDNNVDMTVESKAQNAVQQYKKVVNGQTQDDGLYRQWNH